MNDPKLRMVFVGGSGRSGTSFVHTAIGAHPQVATFLQLELKIMSSYGGLLDLFRTLTDDYAPSRATEVLIHFDRVTERLVSGGFGQRTLGGTRPGELLRDGFARFRGRLVTHGHPRRMDPAEFFEHAQVLIEALADAAIADRDPSENDTIPRVLLEKTPHNLLFIDFLSRLAPGAAFIHVMRDPRAVANSVHQMPWGPDSLAGSAEYVRSYCEAWAKTRQEATARGHHLLELLIEDVVEDPARYSSDACAHFGLEETPHLFDRGHTATLDRRLSGITTEQRALLDRVLGPIAHEMGYDPETIGRRQLPVEA